MGADVVRFGKREEQQDCRVSRLREDRVRCGTGIVFFMGMGDSPLRFEDRGCDRPKNFVSLLSRVWGVYQNPVEEKTQSPASGDLPHGEEPTWSSPRVRTVTVLLRQVLWPATFPNYLTGRSASTHTEERM